MHGVKSTGVKPILKEVASSRVFGVVAKSVSLVGMADAQSEAI
jgi:hypothetical protein